MITFVEELKTLRLDDYERYTKFHSRLLPGINEEIIGVKIPLLKKFAKEKYKENPDLCKDFTKSLPHIYLEEYIIHGAFCSYLSDNINELFVYLDEFLPYVDNWEVCDTICPKLFKNKKNKKVVREKLITYLYSKNVYMVRFAIVSFLQYFLDDDFDKEDLDLFSSIDSEEYYINMAIAWYYSFALIKKYNETIDLFENKILSKWIHNKSLQKAIESFRIDSTKKEYLRSLKIKN